MGVWASKPALLLLLLLSYAWTGCGSSVVDPTVLPRWGWGQAAAEVECRHIFGCCDATEQPILRWPDETTCRQMLAEALQTGLDETFAQGVLVYDAKAARRCIDETAAVDCMHLPPDAIASLLGPSCGQAIRGALPQGAVCEDLDVICQSGNCLGTCGPPRPCWQVMCEAGQYCDVTLSACTPTKADGTACGSVIECTPPSVCVAGLCAAPLPEGAPCTTRDQCASQLCGSTLGACSPRFCDGI